MTVHDILLGRHGRLSRGAFLVWGLPVLGVAVLLYLGIAWALVRGFDMDGARSEGMAALAVLALGAFPFAALIAKRLHDCGLSAWWLLALATPEILNSAGLALGSSGTRVGSVLDYASLLGGAGLAMLAAWPGTRGANRFGEAAQGRPWSIADAN